MNIFPEHIALIPVAVSILQLKYIDIKEYLKAWYGRHELLLYDKEFLILWGPRNQQYTAGAEFNKSFQ